MKERDASYTDFQQRIFDELEEKDGQIRENAFKKLIPLGQEIGLDVNKMLAAGMVASEIIRIVRERYERALGESATSRSSG